MFDFPELPLPRIFPLGTILFNFLFILISIPIEAYVLNSRLKFDKKTSAFYAISLNLYSNVIGWLIFFFVEPLLPVLWKKELLNYVFFNRLQSPEIQPILVLTAFIIFFGTFLVKYFLLRILLFSLTEPGKGQQETLAVIQRNSRRALKVKWQSTNIITSVLISNGLSYTLIVVVLFLR